MCVKSPVVLVGIKDGAEGSLRSGFSLNAITESQKDVQH